MKYLGSRVLETDRLLLRPTKEEDLKVIWGILCDKRVAKNYLVGKFNYDWEKEKVWQYKKLEKANNEDVFQWSIILKSENKLFNILLLIELIFILLKTTFILSFSIFQSLDRRRRFPSYLPSSTSSNSASSISESPPIFTIFSFSSLALRILRMEYWLSRSVTP